MKRYLSPLAPNARTCLSFFPLWAIPYTFYLFYLSLYLKEMGVTDAQIGNIMVAANVMALVSSLVASPVVDRLGRRNATLIFDLISSVLPVSLLLVWPRYEIALIAMAFSGLNRIMSIGYYLLMIEDEPQQNSVIAMNIFNIILVVSGLLTPIAGLFVLRWGVIKAERVFLSVALVTMTAQAIGRHLLIKETPTGLKVRERKREEGSFCTPSTYLAVYRDLVSSLRGNRSMLSAVATNALIYVYFTVGTTASLFFTPFFIDFVRLAPSQVSVIGGVYSLGTLAAMVGINPRLRRKNLSSFTIASSLLSLFGFLLLFLLPKGGILYPVVAVTLIALSYGVLKTTADALLAVETHGEGRSAIYAASNLLSSILGIVVIKITSTLYGHSPGWLLIMCALLLCAILILTLFTQAEGSHGNP